MLATMPDIRESQQSSSRPQTVVAQLRQVSKTFGEVQALRNLDFSVRAGELLALLGPNGAGKTTAVKLFLGLARPTTGSVSVFGGNPVHAEVRTRIGAMLQVAKVPETLRVREHIDLFSYLLSAAAAAGLRLWPSPVCRRSRTVLSANFPEDRSSESCSPWPCAAIPTFCSSTNPP